MTKEEILLVKKVMLSECDKRFTDEDCEQIVEEAERVWEYKGER